VNKFSGFNLCFDESSEGARSVFIGQVTPENTLDLKIICGGTLILQAHPLHKTRYIVAVDSSTPTKD